MKHFIAKLFTFSLAAFCCFYVACLGIKAMGLSDWAYKRFTVEKQQSLVLGTSRSAQGIQPEVVNSMLGEQYADVYNFSFTVSASPYGETYYRAIQKMMDKTTVKNRLYILSVDPWGLSDEKEWDAKGWREQSSCLGQVPFFHQNPNPLYLGMYFHLRNFEWLQAISIDELQDDGLYRVDFDMVHSDTAANIKFKLDTYKGYTMSRSEYRLSWLRKTIELLKQQGDVYLCRIPVHIGMLAIENTNWPTFDTEMRNIAEAYDVPYYSFADRCGNYRTTDGNHLYKEDATLFTRHLCDSIAQNARMKY